MTKQSRELSQQEKAELLKLATSYRQKAYIPYSHFAVGAAVLTAQGNYYGGCNIENASYGATNCAERTAIFKAVSEGEQDIVALAVIADTAEPVTPCGICRQVIAEFAIPVIVMGNLQGATQTVDWKQLLPGAFLAKDMNK